MYAYPYMYSVFPSIKVCACNYKWKEDKVLLMELPLIVKWWEGRGEGTGQGLKGDTFLLYFPFFRVRISIILYKEIRLVQDITSKQALRK